MNRESAHREAVTGLEAAFSELMAEFRRFSIHAAETASPGMLPATFKVLAAIDRGGPVTLSRLAERLASDKGQLSRSVSELEELGLVERTADPEDGRVRLIAPTPLGTERAAAARKPYEDRLSGILSEWSVESIERLTELLHALTTGDRPAG